MGWEKFKHKTEENKVFLKIANMTDTDPELMLKLLEKEMESLKYACFGKVKVYSKSKSRIALEKLQIKKLRAKDRNDEVENLENEIVQVLNIIS